MSVDYREQYKAEHLEPFWPNEIVKMTVVVLCTLAIIMLLAVSPVLLEMVGLEGMVHEEEPADPYGATPVGIKPEWYFLATYQYLKLMPSEFLGVSGKTWGVLTQGPLAALIILLPFWYRRAADRRPTRRYTLIVTGVVLLFLGLTIWGGWPEKVVDGEEQLLPLTAYIGEQPMLFALTGVALVVFYLLIWQERRAIRRVLDGPAPRVDPNREKRS
jgi:quinol-cytochrome oxidoreductase complex cytochrome b subunit